MNKKKAMFITPSDMYDKCGNGGVKVSQKNYKFIEDYFGEENTFLCTFPRKTDTKPPEGAFVFARTQSTLEQLVAAMFGCKVYLPWDERKIISFIKEKKIDVLFIDTSVLGRLTKVDKKISKIVFYHNVEADYAWNKVKNEGFQYLPSYWASKYNDKCGMKAERIMCLNERDQKRLKELYGRNADMLLPVTLTDVFDERKTSNIYKREILFLGSLFPPNQASIEWFIKEVMPKLDNIRLNIVGRGFEALKAVYEENKNVHVIGSVEDPGEYYYRHALVVQPIKYGAGMKVKTAEAMMYGRMILASDEALEGYEVDGVEGIVRCNSSNEYAEAINNFFERKEFQRYYPEVRKLFMQKYNTECQKERFRNFMDCLLKET